MGSNCATWTGLSPQWPPSIVWDPGRSFVGNTDVARKPRQPTSIGNKATCHPLVGALSIRSWCLAFFSWWETVSLSSQGTVSSAMRMVLELFDSRITSSWSLVTDTLSGKTSLFLSPLAAPSWTLDAECTAGGWWFYWSWESCYRSTGNRWLCVVVPDVCWPWLSAALSI